MLRFKKTVLIAIVLSLALVFAAGCGTTVEPGETITIGYVNWAEAIAMTYLVQGIIEDNLGLNVETVQADVGPVFTGVARGDFDFFLDVWLPVTHESYINEVGDDVVDYGVVYEGAKIGLVVPAYVTIDSIEEMNEYKDNFKGQIVGIDAGAGIMKASERAIEDYGLDFELVAASEPAMTAALSDAINSNEWVAVTGWSPHWKFARWDLKYLEDPLGIYGGEEYIAKIGRQGLDTDAPEVANLLRNFTMTDDQLGAIQGLINDGMSPLEAGRQWASENQDIVKSWLN